MIKTLKDLVLALLNATLILLSICLFLGWKLFATLKEAREGFTENLSLVAPLRDDVRGVRSDLQGLRSQLATLSETGAAQPQIQRTLARLNEIEGRIEAAQTRLSDLADKPEQLIDYTITKSADAFANRVADLRGCSPAS
ncbi:MAG: hypothetical protein AB3N21_19100 [Ruegeria sp.]|uniref:hypothetical protein n=1 Tax=Ruegeria sp. TaxID=1879320 RepID=UPI00349ED885